MICYLPLIGKIKYVCITKAKTKSQTYICRPGHGSLDNISPENALVCSHSQLHTFFNYLFPVSLSAEYIKYLRRDLRGNLLDR